MRTVLNNRIADETVTVDPAGVDETSVNYVCGNEVMTFYLASSWII